MYREESAEQVTSNDGGVDDDGGGDDGCGDGDYGDDKWWW